MFLRNCLLVSAGLVSGAALADPMFTPEEYAAVTTAAVTQFKADAPDHVSMFYGITLTRNVQDGTDIGVLARVYMQMDGGTPSVIAKYNCHKHETGVVECHPA